MHELIEKIIVHAPDKSSGHRTQQIEIHYRFNVAVSVAVADRSRYGKKKKGCVTFRLRNLFFKNIKLLYGYRLNAFTTFDYFKNEHRQENQPRIELNLDFLLDKLTQKCYNDST